MNKILASPDTTARNMCMIPSKYLTIVTEVINNPAAAVVTVWSILCTVNTGMVNTTTCCPSIVLTSPRTMAAQRQHPLLVSEYHSDNR